MVSAQKRIINSLLTDTRLGVVSIVYSACLCLGQDVRALRARRGVRHLQDKGVRGDRDAFAPVGVVRDRFESVQLHRPAEARNSQLELDPPPEHQMAPQRHPYANHGRSIFQLLGDAFQPLAVPLQSDGPQTRLKPRITKHCLTWRSV